MKPVIHYDHCLGADPRWRAIVHQALQGDVRQLSYEYLALQGFAPTAAHLLAAMYAYARNGQQVFVAGPRLQALFSQTDLESIPKEFLKLPFDCFYIALPHCSWSLYGGTRTGWHPVAGVYVNQISPGGIILSMWGQENEKSRWVGDDASFWLALNLNECPSKVVGEGADAAHALDIEQYITNIFSDTTRGHSDAAAEVPIGKDFERYMDTARHLVRIVFNLVLYVNSLQPEQTRVPNPNRSKAKKLRRRLAETKPTRRERLQKELDALCEAEIVWLGPTIEHEPKERDVSDPGGRSKVKRHLRRGHWHPYWIGPRQDASGNPRKGDKQVLRWFRPMWIGSEGTDLVHARGRHFQFNVERDD